MPPQLNGFYFDEQLPHKIAEALNILESHDGKNRVLSTAKEFGKGISDADLFQKLKDVGGILVTHDLKMMTRKQEFDLIRQLGVSVFIISLPSGASYDVIWQTIIQKWTVIKDVIRKNRHSAIVCRVKMKGKPEILN